jgi:HNH endonuclease
MTGRPRIPVEIKREVLFEARHRCAVCCHPLTLEMAHIIPWCETQDHSLENLIALCPNCHTLADQEKWGAAYLKRYKDAPCAIASNSLPPLTPTKKALIDLILSADPEALNEKERLRLISMLAAYLDIRIAAIELISVTRCNSSCVRMRMPARTARQLKERIIDSDDRLQKTLSGFEIIGVKLYSESKGELQQDEDELLIFVPDGEWKRLEQPIVDRRTGEPVGTVELHFVFEESKLCGAVEFKVDGGLRGEIRMQLSILGERRQVIHKTPVFTTSVGARSLQRPFEYSLEYHIRYRAADVSAHVTYTPLTS